MSDEQQDPIDLLEDVPDLYDEEIPDFGLNHRMKLFADEWMTGAATGRQFSPISAYRHAGYKITESSPYVNPNKLLKHPKVKKYIQHMMKRFAMDPEELLLRWTELARGSVGEALQRLPNGDVAIDTEYVLKHMRHMVKGVYKDSNDNTRIEFHDPTSAMMQIQRVLGMNKDGLEVSGLGGGAMKIEVEFVNGPGSDQGSDED